MCCNLRYLPTLMVSCCSDEFLLAFSTHCYIHLTILSQCPIGDQPGLKREIGHKPIRGLCQRLKGKVYLFRVRPLTANASQINMSTQANRDDFVVT